MTLSCSRCTDLAITSYLGANQAILDIDGDGERDALIDGVLLLRFLFGFTDDSLVSGAVDGDCTRCTGAAVSAYLAPLT